MIFNHVAIQISATYPVFEDGIEIDEDRWSQPIGSYYLSRN